jgi:AMP-binding enzyme C-terminal domain
MELGVGLLEGDVVQPRSLRSPAGSLDPRCGHVHPTTLPAAANRAASRWSPGSTSDVEDVVVWANASCVGTPLKHTKRKSAGWLTFVSSAVDLSCPSWARAEGGRRPVRTLLIQRGPWNRLNPSDLQPITRVRVTQCWSLLGFLIDFAVLYSFKCQGLLLPSSSFEVSLVAIGLGSSLASAATTWREELKTFVRDRLEPYKHPREVIFVESLSRMHLGKWT